MYIQLHAVQNLYITLNVVQNLYVPLHTVQNLIYSLAFCVKCNIFSRAFCAKSICSLACCAKSIFAFACHILRNLYIKHIFTCRCLSYNQRHVLLSPKKTGTTWCLFGIGMIGEWASTMQSLNFANMTVTLKKFGGHQTPTERPIASVEQFISRFVYETIYTWQFGKSLERLGQDYEEQFWIRIRYTATKQHI